MPRERRDWTRLTPVANGTNHQAWEHKAGWIVQHCGHPTANRPWGVYEPKGDGVYQGCAPKFARLSEAFDYCERRTRVVIAVIPASEVAHG